MPGGSSTSSAPTVVFSLCPAQAELGISAEQRAALMAARREMLRSIGLSQQERRHIQQRMHDSKSQVGLACR